MVISVLLIATILLAHTRVLASIRYSAVYFLLYFFLVILLINLFFTRRLFIRIAMNRLQVQMPRFNAPGSRELPAPGRAALLDIPWEEIEQVRVTDRKVTLITRNDVVEEFSLVYLNHRATRKLKNTLQRLAESHGITIRVT